MLEPTDNSLNITPVGGVPSAKPHSRRRDAVSILQRLRQNGYIAYLAGGCVRDLLLGREPMDWDIATDAPPARVRAIFPNTQAVGAAFGVILVRYHGNMFEVATFRADAEYTDGRRPTGVRFTTPEEDAKRRDFTINGLFLDPFKAATLDEQVIDFVEGRHDLAANVLRAIGDPEARFNEDHLRMLRAVRFAARYGFEIDPATASAIIRHAPQLIRVSPERIAEELRIMLTPPTRVEAYRILEKLGLRRLLFRFLDLPQGTGSVNQDVSLFAALPARDAIPFSFALTSAAIDTYLWHGPINADIRRLFERPTAQKIVRALRQSLKISNDESDEILGTLTGLDPLLQSTPAALATLKRFLARPTSASSRTLLEAARSIGVLEPGRIIQLQSTLTDLEKTDFAPPPLITGDDLTAAGLAPGPKFKIALDATYNAQLENRIVTRAEAMALALRIITS